MKKVLIAGASGFIGHALIEYLLKTSDCEIVAISRTHRISPHPRLEWRQCDLYSLKDITSAMQGCDRAYYLVHSMLPSASLSQGRFYDFDLIMADNFVRAGIFHQVKHFIYLGGMIPPFEELSWHLQSRLEVEETLRNSGIPTTALRAGLIIGANGSSFTIIKRLIERLPIMICPSWTKTLTQPIALGDMLKVLGRALKDEKVRNGIYDVGGKEIVSYLDIIFLSSKKIKRERKLITFNIIPLWFSRLWITLVTGVPKNLVYPLVLSLKHEMLVQISHQWPFEEDLDSSLDEALSLAIAGSTLNTYKGHIPLKKDVRSVQRMVLPCGKDASWVAAEYFRWLPNFFSSLIKVSIEGDRCIFYLINPALIILILEKNEARSTNDRQLLYVVGGLLSGKQERGRLEFREVLGKKFVIAALHEFRPSLPWFVYKWTQAIVHLIVMKTFGEHLKWHVISEKKVMR